MKIEKKDLEKSQIEIHFELTNEEIEPYLKKAAIHLSEHLKIDGFRPGKAPYDVVKKHAGEMAVYEEALDEIVRKTLFDYISKENIEAIGQPEVDVEKIAPGNPIAYKAVVTLLPKVELCDYKTAVKIKREEIKVGEDRVEKIIGDFQKMYAKEKLADREAKKGDKIEIDMDILIDKVPIDQGHIKKQAFIGGESFFIKGFDEQIYGMKKGETKEFKLKFPGNHYRKDLAGKEADFKVTVLAIYDRELPEINDEFAKQLSAKNLEELKKRIREDLLREAQAKQEQSLEVKMLKEMVEKCKFGPIPDLLINSEIDKMIDELKTNVMQQGIGFEDYLQSINKKVDDLKVDFAGQAMERVKTALMTREISKNETIKVDQKEVNEEIEKYLRVYGQDEKIRQTIESPEYRDYLVNVLANRKLIDILKGIIIE